VRYSAPFFFNPNYDAEVKPLTKEESAKYSAFSWGHFRKERFLGDYSDRGREIQIEDYAI
jgi:isopenicillin N synthase-like dioxygenase